MPEVPSPQALARIVGKELAPKEADSRAELRERLQAELRDKVYTDSLGILDAAGDAFELDETMTAPPEEWVKELGKREATRRFRIAVEARKSNKDAPVALKMALANVANREKAKALEGGPLARTLNVNFINIQAPEFPRQRLEDDE